MATAAGQTRLTRITGKRLRTGSQSQQPAMNTNTQSEMLRLMFSSDKCLQPHVHSVYAREKNKGQPFTLIDGAQCCKSQAEVSIPANCDLAHRVINVMAVTAD